VSPGFSVVVPTLDRPQRLARCLEALAAVHPPSGGFEAIVVDDGGRTPLGPIVGAMGSRLDARLRVVPHGGPAAARNAGAAEARGRVLAFTDDDCRPEPGWLTAFEAALGREPQAIVGGRTVNGLPENTFSAASQALVDYLYSYYAAHPERPRFFASNNVALTRACFDAIGGFDVGFRDAAGEDREFCHRAHHQGHPMLRVPEAVVRHEHALGPRSFLKQHFTYGRGARRFHTLRSARYSEPLRLEPLSFYLALPREPFDVIPRDPRAWRLASLLVLSQAANAAGFFWPSKEV
jgi:glycosyltransferase involved in cell wall biosynthesis